MSSFLRTALLGACVALPAIASAQTTVQEPWVRATVAQQKASAMFARVTSTQGGKLVGASSPVAGVVEVHEMTTEGNVMKMRAVASLDLPAGKAVVLSPSGYHVMLMDLKQALKEGETVPVTLVVEGKDGKRENVEVKAAVRPLAAAAGGKGHEGHEGHKH
jgi:hypothetical protein